jgi:hypothetical protein
MLPYSYTEPDVKISVTELDEPFDGNLYTDLLRSATQMTASDMDVCIWVRDLTTGKIFYHLVFKPISPLK